MGDDGDFDKSDTGGFASFREAFNSTREVLDESKSQLIDDILGKLAPHARELYAEGQIEERIEFEWPRASGRFREEVASELQTLINHSTSLVKPVLSPALVGDVVHYDGGLKVNISFAEEEEEEEEEEYEEEEEEEEDW